MTQLIRLLVSAAVLSCVLGLLLPDPAQGSSLHSAQYHLHHHRQPPGSHYNHQQLQQPWWIWRQQRRRAGWSKPYPLYPAEAEQDPFYPAVVSCRYFCPRPDYHLYLAKHWYYCCLPNTPGATLMECPAQTGRCRSGDLTTPAVTPEVTALLTCAYDSQCPSHRDLCCYDVCHHRNVCKRADLSHVPHH